MKIAIYGASGMIGSRLAAEALNRGHEVTGVTRSGGEQPAGTTAVQGSANDPQLAGTIAAEADVVVSAIGPSRTGGDREEFLDAIKTLVAAAGGTRLVVVGGAGSLVVDGQRLLDSPHFPEIYHDEALVSARSLEYLRGLDENVDWTFLSPPAVIEPGERTGVFKLGLDSPVGDWISAEDFAVALIDEVEKPVHGRQRFTVSS